MKLWVCEPAGAGKLSHYTFSLCTALSELGHEVTLYTSREYELGKWKPCFKVEGIYGRRGFMHVPRLLRRLGDQVPDVLHLQGVRRSDIALIKLFEARGVKVVCTPHHVLPHRRRFYHLPLYGMVYRAVGKVIVHSYPAMEMLVDIFGVSPSRIQVIPEGNYSIYRSGKLFRAEAKKALGIEGETKAMLFFGYMHRSKGLELLLQAFKAVRKGNECKLIVAGEPCGELQRYTRLIRQLGLEGDVVFKPAYIPIQEVERFFEAADFTVLPYLRPHNTPMVQLSYTFGLPVVATEAARENVEHERSGLIVPVNDVEALAKAIEELVRDEGKLASLSERALELSQTRYSWKTIAEETVESYKEA